MCAPGRAHMEKHYADLSKKPFFKDLVDYMISGPVVCMVWEGLGAVKCGRMMLGETNPQASLPGSIRGDMSIQVGRNICHGSDSVESATAEIALWFKKEEKESKKGKVIAKSNIIMDIKPWDDETDMKE